ncbi:MAG: tetratricopeptide repeat protein, partial [Sulfuricurvum sp.]|nr:tetratricopeptide repeat protein [Sulfuricurvum sp.]
MTNTKTFRLFVSSTFGDFRREREILQTKIFPKIKSYASSLGYTFQPIDLRWGVSAEAQLDQKTLQLCLEEVSACKTYPHPNFLIMAGDRYGWVPLPYTIEEYAYETLLVLMSADEQNRVNEWYKLDRNQIPASYILKERTGEYVDYDAWASVENTLRSILQTAVNSSTLTEDQKRKYFLSATEAEVEEGIIPYLNETKRQQELLAKNSKLKEIDPHHIFGFFRDIDKSSLEKYKLFEDDKEYKNKFFDDDIDYKKAQAFKGRVRSILPDSNNVLGVKTTQFDKERLDEEYLEQKIPEVKDESFEYRIKSFLESQIDSLVEKESDNTFTSLDIETDAQRYFAEQKRKNFIGQQTSLDAISKYIFSDDQRPLAIYGPSGRGKSSLMAQAIESAKNKPIYRFVGATPNSGSSKDILTSIFEELEIDVRSEDDKETFEQFSYRIHDQIMRLKDITIFIDAVDQLGNDDQFLWLPQTLPSNVKIIISALEDEYYSDDSRYFQTLQQKTTNLHEIPEFNDPITLLRNILSNEQLPLQEQRTLQVHQETYFLEQFQSSPSPLYISIAAQEMKHWKSNDRVAEGKNPEDADGEIQSLASTQKGIIEEFITNLTKLHHHDQRFVHKVLGYLYASRDGLSESELLQLISTDEAFIESMAPETYHDNLTKELPMVHWSRLHTQLKPFLSIKRQDNEDLMYFFHREFEDSIKSLASHKDEHKAIIEATQKLITKYQHESFSSNRWGKLYANLITEYELRFYTREEQRPNINKTNQTRFAEYIAKLDQQEWITEFYRHLNLMGSNYSQYNRMYQSIAYQEACLNLTGFGFLKDRRKWGIKFCNSLNNLAESYGKQNHFWAAIQLVETSKGNLMHTDMECDMLERFELLLSAFDYESLFNLKWRGEEDSSALVQYLDYAKAFYLAPAESPIPREKVTKCYVNALSYMSLWYKAQSSFEEAITYQEESLQILETSYVADPSRWEREYLFILNNIVSLYVNVSQVDKAIELAQKSFEISSALYTMNPDLWVEEYIVSLKGLILCFTMLKNIEEAFILEDKSLSKLEELYIQNPDRWIGYYIGSINSMADLYVKKDRLLDAIKLYKKSFLLSKKLYSIDASLGYKYYIFGLINQAFIASGIGENSKAIVLQSEFIPLIITSLGDRSPEMFSCYIALNRLADSYKKEGFLYDAIYLYKFIIDMDGITHHIDSYKIELHLEICNKLADLYIKQNRFKEAIEIIEEFIDNIKFVEVSENHTYDDYIKDYQTLKVYLNDIKQNLSNSFECNEDSSNQNHLDVEIELEEKSLYIRETRDSEEWIKDYIREINSLITLSYNKNRIDEVIKLEGKILQIYAELYEKNPDAWVYDYTSALNNMATSHSNQNRLDEAITLKEKCLQIRELLYQGNPDRWAEDYATALNNLANSYYYQNRLDEAITLEEKCLQIRELLYQGNPDRWAGDYATALNNLAISYYDQNRLDEAITLY